MRQSAFADNRDVQIKTIKLENFQTHTEKTVVVSPGITTIKGATDKGKSAILRAVGWCCLNNVSGAEFVKEGTKQATVTITTDNATVKRVRGASGKTNTYEMDGEEYKAFGTGVPEDIANRLGLDNINFQNQHDAPFWFSETAGEVSRRLNAVIDLSVIDSSLSAVYQSVKKNECKKGLCEDQLEEINKELKDIEPQRERVTEFRALEELKERYDELEENSDTLAQLIETVRANKSKQHRARYEEASTLLELADEAIGFSRRMLMLKWSIEKGEDLASRSVSPPPFDAVEEAHDNFKIRTRQVEELEYHIRCVEDRKKDVTAWERSLEVRTDRLHKQTKGKECPLCGNQIA
jgi:chromosome segregation ATPase